MFLGGPPPCVCDDYVETHVQRDIAPLIRRETDAELHNLIANHPQVKPTLGYNGDQTDFTALLDHPEAYVFLSDGCGAAGIFEWSAPGVWQSHSMALPEVRGRRAVEAGRAMCRYMFETLGAQMLWGMTPIDHRAARTFNRLVGLSPTGQQGVDAAGVAVAFYTLRSETCLFQ